jgi:hypothetical protein
MTDTWVGDGGGATGVFCESERDVREEICERERRQKKKIKIEVLGLGLGLGLGFFFLISSRAGQVST